MLRKSLLAVFTLVVCVGISLSDEIRAVILKVDLDKNEVTFAPLEGKGKDAKKGDPKTLPIATDVKVMKGGKKGDPGDPIEGGLKAAMFGKINAEKGMRANITTSDDNKKITAITVVGGGKKKKDQ
jgi:hypothetical protein